MSVPVIIINRNWLTYLRDMVEELLKRGCTDITVIDNASTYPPLLDYYNKLTMVRVLRLSDNMGPWALCQSSFFWDIVKNDRFILSDPDIDIKQTPLTLVSDLVCLKDKYKEYNKIGVALRVDDLPDALKIKTAIQKWEARFWLSAVEPDIYAAPVDTTFALWEGGVGSLGLSNCLRVAGEYTCRHRPWYIDFSGLSEEEAYWYERARGGLGFSYIKHAATNNTYCS